MWNQIVKPNVKSYIISVLHVQCKAADTLIILFQILSTTVNVNKKNEISNIISLKRTDGNSSFLKDQNAIKIHIICRK